MSSDVSKTKLIFFLIICGLVKFYGQSERRSIEFFCFLCVYFYVLPVFLSKSVHVSNYDRSPIFFKIRVHKFDRVVQSFFSKSKTPLKNNVKEFSRVLGYCSPVFFPQNVAHLYAKQIKTSHRNIQYSSHLLSKCQITSFSPVPTMVEDAWETLLLLMYPWCNIYVYLINIYIYIYMYVYIYVYICIS